MIRTVRHMPGKEIFQRLVFDKSIFKGNTADSKQRMIQNHIDCACIKEWTILIGNCTTQGSNAETHEEQSSANQAE